MHGQNTADIATHGEQSAGRRLLSVGAVAATLGGIGRREVYKRLNDGDMESVWIGRRRLVTATSVDAYVERLRAEAKARTAA